MKKMIVPSLKVIARHMGAGKLKEAKATISKFDLEGYSALADAMRRAYWSTGDKEFWNIALYLGWEIERRTEI